MAEENTNFDVNAEQQRREEAVRQNDATEKAAQQEAMASSEGLDEWATRKPDVVTDPTLKISPKSENDAAELKITPQQDEYDPSAVHAQQAMLADAVGQAGGPRPDLLPVSAFQDKREAFKIIKSLEKQLDEALSAKTPEDLATNMLWMILNAPFKTFNDWAEHRKEENKRLDKEYKANVAEFEKSRGVDKLGQVQQLFDAVVPGLPPEFAQFKDAEGRLDIKSMPNGVKKDFQKYMFNHNKARDIVQGASGHQFTDKEWGNICEMAGKMEKAPMRLQQPKQVEAEKPKGPTTEEIMQETLAELKKTNKTMSMLLQLNSDRGGLEAKTKAVDADAQYLQDWKRSIEEKRNLFNRVRARNNPQQTQGRTQQQVHQQQGGR